MNTQIPDRDMSALTADAIAYTMDSLVTHMDQCRNARSRWFRMQAKAELAHAVITSHLVTCGAVVALCCFALMSVA